MTIHEAARSGNLAAVEQLLKSGTDVNATDNDGWSALMIACRENQLGVAKILIVAGGEVNASGPYDYRNGAFEQDIGNTAAQILVSAGAKRGRDKKPEQSL